MIVSLKEVKNYLRIDFDDDDKLIYQLIDTAQKLCMEIVRTDDISVLNADKKKHTRLPFCTPLRISMKTEKKQTTTR